MASHLKPALVLLLAFSVITGVIYPAVVTGAAQLLFPSQANGSIVSRNGRPMGSSLIGQEFTSPRYFWGRLSATASVPYNGAASSGSNYGPLNPALAQATDARVAQLRDADSGRKALVPVDLATASGSGLDPHISIASARYQVLRVARERGISQEQVLALVRRHTEGRDLGFLGEPGVNVLALNLALDALQTSREKN
jgi:potassium-transporting ATPase KdpC subunit